MAKHRPLGRRVLVWLFGYTFLMVLAVFGTAQYLHERAEHGVWRSLLNSELDSILDRSAQDPGYRWQDSDTLRLFRVDGSAQVPPALRSLHPGLHDDLEIAGRQSAVMVRDTTHAGRLALVLDITDFEALEHFLTRWMLAAGIALITITVLMGTYAMARLVRPLVDLARDIGALRPERRDQRIAVGPQGSTELYVIADALNDYLERNGQFVERERAFIDSASHELRTPIAVIGNAAELALEQPDTPAVVRHQLQRIAQTSGAVEQLITLLLVLARTRAGWCAAATRCAWINCCRRSWPTMRTCAPTRTCNCRSHRCHRAAWWRRWRSCRRPSATCCATRSRTAIAASSISRWRHRAWCRSPTPATA